MSALFLSIIVAIILLLVILTLQSNSLHFSSVLGLQSPGDSINNDNTLNANTYKMNHDISLMSTSASSSSSSLSPTPSNDFCLKYLETCDGNQGTELEEDASPENDTIRIFQKKYSQIIDQNNNSDTGTRTEAPVAAEGQESMVPQRTETNVSAANTSTAVTMTDDFGLHPPGL